MLILLLQVGIVGLVCFCEPGLYNVSARPRIRTARVLRASPRSGVTHTHRAPRPAHRIHDRIWRQSSSSALGLEGLCEELSAAAIGMTLTLQRSHQAIVSMAGGIDNPELVANCAPLPCAFITAVRGVKTCLCPVFCTACVATTLPVPCAVLATTHRPQPHRAPATA